jgi:hypothetical protein
MLYKSTRTNPFQVVASEDHSRDNNSSPTDLVLPQPQPLTPLLPGGRIPAPLRIPHTPEGQPTLQPDLYEFSLRRTDTTFTEHAGALTSQRPPQGCFIRPR